MKKPLRISQLGFGDLIVLYKVRYCKPKGRYIRNYTNAMKRATELCKKLRERDSIVTIHGFSGHISGPEKFEDYTFKKLKSVLISDEVDCVIFIRSYSGNPEEYFDTIKEDLKLHDKKKHK